MTAQTSAQAPVFAERLWVPVWWWALAALTVAVLGAEVHLGLGRVVAVVTYGVLGLFVATLLVRWSTQVRVDDASLHAGGRRVPLAHIVDIRVVAHTDARSLLAARPDPTAVVLLRGYARNAVCVSTDGDDLPSYLLLSTRRPNELVAALTGSVAD